MRKLGFVLALALLARAGEPPPDAPVFRSHGIADFAPDSHTLAVAFARVRAVVGDAKIQVEEKAIQLVVPAAVHERVERALKEVREGRGKIITLEVHFVKLTGDAGVKEVPADKLDAFLAERRAERIAAHTFACRNLCTAGTEFVREIPCVPDFDVEMWGMGGVTLTARATEPAKETWTARFEPAVVGAAVRVTAQLSVEEVVMEEFTSLLANDLIVISLPEAKPRTIHCVLTCTPGAFAVVNLEGSVFALVRATVADAPASR